MCNSVMNPELGVDYIALLPVAFKHKRNKMLVFVPNLFAHNCDINTKPYKKNVLYLYSFRVESAPREDD